MRVSPVERIRCPWCGVGPGEPCLTGLGKRLKHLHKARQDAYEKKIKEGE